MSALRFCVIEMRSPLFCNLPSRHWRDHIAVIHLTTPGPLDGIKTLHLTNAYHATSGDIRTFYRALLAQANEEQRPFRLVVPGAVDSVEEVGAFARIYSVKARPSPVFDSNYRVLLPGSYLARGGGSERFLRTSSPT